MAKNRIAGVCYVKLTTATGNQIQLALRGGWTVSPSRTKKEGIAGQDAVHGYKEMPEVPFMEGDVSYMSDLDIRALDEAEEITATAELANGKTWVGVQGWRADKSEIDTEEGKLKVKLEFLEVNPLNG